eukprot:4383816-Amphidinium_carterae.1
MNFLVVRGPTISTATSATTEYLRRQPPAPRGSQCKPESCEPAEPHRLMIPPAYYNPQNPT